MLPSSTGSSFSSCSSSNSPAIPCVIINKHISPMRITEFSKYQQRARHMHLIGDTSVMRKCLPCSTFPLLAHTRHAPINTHTRTHTRANAGTRTRPQHTYIHTHAHAHTRTHSMCAIMGIFDCLPRIEHFCLLHSLSHHVQLTWPRCANTPHTTRAQAATH